VEIGVHLPKLLPKNKVAVFWNMMYSFWATVCKTVCPMLSFCCLPSPFLSCLSVTLVYCGQTVGRIKMKLGKQVGLGPRHIVLGGDPAPPPTKGHSPQFSVDICCGQMAAWIKMPLGMELVLGPGKFVLHGDPAPLPKGSGAPKFLAHVYCG